jgi:ketosteroid isomerase-like protein
MAAVVAGRMVMADDVRATLGAMIETWSWLEVAPIALLIDGERAAAHNRVRLRFEPTGEEVETQILDLFTIRDGRIVHLIEFVDTALLARLMAAAAAGKR